MASTYSATINGLDSSTTIYYDDVYATSSHATSNWKRISDGYEIYAKKIYPYTSDTTACEWDWRNSTAWEASRWQAASRVRYYKYVDVPTATDRIKEIIRTRRAPGIITNSKPMGHTIDGREIRARETLRRVIGDDSYNRFLRQGWVSVRARSGLVYRIYPGHGITEVYNKGIMQERLCVVLNGNFPPTDSLIIRYLLILNSEHKFRDKAIKHNVPKSNDKVKIAVEHRPLVEIAREIKNIYAKVG